jgi:Domain of unknown function (DUF4214)/Prealbumin-like fold domain
MRLAGSRSTMGLSALLVGIASVVLAVGNGDHVTAGAAAPTPIASGPFDVVVQTMDSCKSGLDQATYQLTGPSGTFTAGTHAAGNSSPGSIGASPSCPLEQGNCVTTTKGCIVFTNVPPGDYRLKQTAAPNGNLTNPDGYAPCEGGSACQWEQADVTVNPGGSVVALVTNIEPNGKQQTWPTPGSGHAKYYAGSAADPVVFHDFGLANPGSTQPNGTPNVQCDGDGDADDFSTGTPGSQCGYPEASENVCASSPAPPAPLPSNVRFPWQCLSGPTTVQHLVEIVLTVPSSVNAFEAFPVSLSSGAATSLSSTYPVTDASGTTRTVTESVMSVSGGPGAFQVILGHPGTQTISAMNGGSALAVGTVVVNPGDGVFVANLYHDILGRSGAPSEVGYWVNQMHAGEPAWAVAEFFSQSDEYRGHMVATDYTQMVGVTLAPNDPGLAYWTHALATGTYNEAVIGSLASSPSFYNQPVKQGGINLPGGTDASFVTDLYLKVLHRTAAPTTSELQYWIGTYGPFAGNQAARLQVANGMAFSHEQHMYVAGTWYPTFLNRPADLGGQTFWANQLDHGTHDEVGVASLTSTPEYFGLAPKY